MTRAVADAKLQRWIDLVAALLSHHYGCTFEQLTREVPAYSSPRDAASLARMFERDKDELRVFGIPIETQRTGDGDLERYVIDPREMYLPYLTLVTEKSRRRSVGRAGYRSLPTLSLEPDELRAAIEGSKLARSLGDEALKADLDSAIRKLTFDIGEGDAADESQSAPQATGTSLGATLRLIGEALVRRKRLAFRYRSIERDAVGERSVEPYGIFYLSMHWYLAARDVERDIIRNFRVSRMSGVAMNRKRLTTPDFEITPGFRLTEHSRSRESWEIGDAAAEEMIVEFTGDSGAARAAAKLGQSVPGSPSQRAFQVRRLESFARWVLSLAGEAEPVSPATLVDAFKDLRARTLAIYEVAR
jgi:proteasome accessory factor B